MKLKTPNLVCQYLENISRKALYEQYQEIIKKHVRGRHGIYALYRKDKLYYVGLASDLCGRLRIHLRDRHAGIWDRFSIYLTVGAQYLGELEALLLRIIDRKGNKQKGEFGKAEDLKREFRRELKMARDKELKQLLGDEGGEIKKKSKHGNRECKKPILKNFVARRIQLRFKYKGKLYVAYLRRDGSIIFAKESTESTRLQRKVYLSPSRAAKAVTKREMNGWTAWTYERAPGDWVPLNELRKQKA